MNYWDDLLEKKVVHIKKGERFDFYPILNPIQYFAYLDDKEKKRKIICAEDHEKAMHRTPNPLQHRILANVYLIKSKECKILDVPYDYLFPIIDNTHYSKKDYNYFEDGMNRAKRLEAYIGLLIEKEDGKIIKTIDFIEKSLEEEDKKNIRNGIVNLSELIDNLKIELKELD